MPCYGPLTGYKPKRGGPSARLVFDKRKSETGIGIPVPCGQCLGCRLDYAHDWAVRGVCEKRMHFNDEGAFLTLTYDNNNLPADGSLDVEHLQLFMKRLRHEFPAGLRFFACGEYGETTKRAHYHVCLFNGGFKDKKLFKRSERGDPLFTSARLSSLWKFGQHLIGDVTFESIAYVTGYVTKKYTGDLASLYGGRVPPFSLQSTRPGLGRSYLAKYVDELYRSDNIVIRGKETSIPRYFDNVFRDFYDYGPLPRVLDRVKRKRRRLAVMQKADSGTTRLRVKEVVRLARLAQKKRTL